MRMNENQNEIKCQNKFEFLRNVLSEKLDLPKEELFKFLGINLVTKNDSVTRGAQIGKSKDLNSYAIIQIITQLTAAHYCDSFQIVLESVLKEKLVTILNQLHLRFLTEP